MLSQIAPEMSLSLVALVFSEGFLAFLSPCILPMLPVYLLYLCGGNDVNANKKRLIINTLGFIAGFAVIFVLLGAAASGIGSLLSAHRSALSKIGGIIMILFGLNYTGLLKIPFLNKVTSLEAETSNLNFFSSAIFGAAFSVGWTPCLGAFLGAALLMASNTSTLYAGIFLLFVFSIGLGIPFLLTALLWSRIQGAMGFIKRNFKIIKIVSGGLLIFIGLLMVFDLFNVYLNLLS